MGKARLLLLALGIPGLLAFATLAAAQWQGARALMEFDRLQKAHRPDSLSPPAPAILAAKEATLLRAARFAPDHPEPAYQTALLRLVQAESASLQPSETAGSTDSGPGPGLQVLLRDSLRAINRAIVLNPGYADYHFVKATILQNLEQTLPPPATQAARGAVRHLLATSDRLDPYKPSLHYRTGSFYLALGDREQAKNAFTVALMDSFQYGKLVFDLLWSTVEDTDELQSLVGPEPLARALLGNFLWLHGQPDQAEQQFSRLEGVPKLDYRTGEILIAHRLRERQFERARKAISRLEAASPPLAPYFLARLEYFRGRSFAAENRFQEAISSYEKSLLHDSSAVQSHIDLASAYLEAAQPEKAIARWRYVLTRWPKVPLAAAKPGEVHFGLGRAYEALGARREALAEYLRASSEDPANPNFARKASEATQGL